MAKEIKQRIVLEGEKEYNAAIKEANRNLKTLRSELKAETAEMGRNASQSEKAEAKAKNLKKQIAEQEKIVKAYKQTLQEVREKYADNEDAIASWEQKLNNARATLGNMKNELEGVGDSFRKLDADSASAVTATRSVAESIGKIGQVSESIAGSIEGIFSSVLSAISSTVNEIWGMIAETAARANQYTDIAGYWNTDPQKIQQWARAVAASKNEFTDMANAVSKIAFGDHDKIFGLTGVSWSGDIDQWQYAADVMSSIADMDYTHKAAAVEEIFGEKRASKVMDLLNDWKTILELVPKFNGNETGYGMNDQELETMNDLAVQIATIEQSWDALKDKIAAGLGTIIMPLLVDVQGAMDGVAEFLTAENEEEREAALTKIRTNLENFFRRLGEIVTECIGILNEVGQELQNSDDPVTKAIGDILVGLTEALDWMIKNQDAVKTAFEVIFGAWLLLKLGAVAGKLTEIVANIHTIQAFKNWQAPTAGTDGSGTGTGTGTGAGNGTGTENVGTENVTTENVTTQNVTTQNVTTENLSAANITTGNTTTENVQTMYVANMIGGNNGNPSTPTTNPGLPGGGNGFNGYVPILYPGNGNLGAGDGALNLPGVDTVNLPGTDTLNLPSGDTGGNPIELGPNDFSIDGPGTEGPGTENPGPTPGPFADLLWGVLPVLGVLAAGTLPAAFAQWANEAGWKESLEGAEAAADALEDALGEASQDAEILRAAAQAVGPKRKADGSYDTDFTGLFLNMNPTEQRDYVLQMLSDEKMRGILYSDFMRYGDPENDNVAGWRPWSMMMRYWGLPVEDAFGNQTTEPLEGFEVDELVTYIRDIYQRKVEDQLERMKDTDFDSALDNALGAGGMRGVLGGLAGSFLRYLNADQWTGGGNANTGAGQDGITHTDLANFNNLPALIQRAAQAGTANGVSGIRVYMDGVAVGRLVAPTVSQMIAQEIG